MIQILDTHNLYRTSRAKFGDCKLDYAKIHVHRSIAIGQANENSENFENYLRTNGYEVILVKSENPSESGLAQIMAQAVRVQDSHVILGTQNKSIIPLVIALQGRGAFVEIFGAGIPRELRVVCNKWVEITEEHLV